ncbi:MAG TPA: hypothetical protein VN372_03335, partial [Methanospirillum sp.]|nr:hypothetical protein [Methanospirillum sp.]
MALLVTLLLCGGCVTNQGDSPASSDIIVSPNMSEEINLSVSDAILDNATPSYINQSKENGDNVYEGNSSVNQSQQSSALPRVGTVIAWSFHDLAPEYISIHHNLEKKDAEALMRSIVVFDAHVAQIENIISDSKKNPNLSYLAPPTRNERHIFLMFLGYLNLVGDFTRSLKAKVPDVSQGPTYKFNEYEPWAGFEHEYLLLKDAQESYKKLMEKCKDLGIDCNCGKYDEKIMNYEALPQYLSKKQDLSVRNGEKDYGLANMTSGDLIQSTPVLDPTGKDPMGVYVASGLKNISDIDRQIIYDLNIRDVIKTESDGARLEQYIVSVRKDMSVDQDTINPNICPTPSAQEKLVFKKFKAYLESLLTYAVEMQASARMANENPSYVYNPGDTWSGYEIPYDKKVEADYLVKNLFIACK